MNKKILSFIVLLIPFLGFTQIQSGEVIYKVKEVESKEIPDSLKAKNPAAYGYFSDKNKKIKATLPYLDFKLDFNQKESTFQLLQSMETDFNNNLEITTTQIRGDGIYYTDISKNLQLHQFNLLRNLWLIESKLDTIEWKIHRDIKNIAGYQAQKATATVPLNHLKNGEVTAWFTNKIPFQFGPIGVSNLPGLILEYQIQDYVYYAHKIKLSDKEIKIVKPTKGEKVTEKQMMKKIKEDFFNQ